MPEETNRILTDQISDLLFTHSSEATDHLVAEGRRREHIFAVGNTMIDTLVAMRERIRRTDSPARFGLEAGTYLVVTLHRPALVDGPLLADTLAHLSSIAADGIDVVFPIHPRTRDRMRAQGLAAAGVQLTDPLGYLDFLGLVEQAAGVLTDSGGIQEETTYLGIPCFTLRANTERPVTITLGTNELLGLDPTRILDVPGILAGRNGARSEVPPGWDGHAAERLVRTLASLALVRDAHLVRPLRRRSIAVIASVLGADRGRALREQIRAIASPQIQRHVARNLGNLLRIVERNDVLPPRLAQQGVKLTWGEEVIVAVLACLLIVPTWRADLELAARPKHAQRLSENIELDRLRHMLDDLAAVDHSEALIWERKRLCEVVAANIEPSFPTVVDPIVEKLETDRLDPPLAGERQQQAEAAPEIE